MRLSELKHDQQVRARWGHAGRTAPKLGQWRDVVLHVQRGPKGELAVLALKRPDGEPINWAEYGERDLDHQHKLFECEGYYLEIEGLTP